MGCAAQEVLVDPSRDESLIFELLDLKGEVDDAGSALWFLRDIANEQDAGDSLVGTTCFNVIVLHWWTEEACW